MSEKRKSDYLLLKYSILGWQVRQLENIGKTKSEIASILDSILDRDEVMQLQKLKVDLTFVNYEDCY